MLIRHRPRRRAQQAGPMRGHRRHFASHRRARRRGRGAVFVLAIVSTLLVGAAAMFINPRGAEPASASTPLAQLATAVLDPVRPAVVAKPDQSVVVRAEKSSADPARLPANSGTGRRVVFSQSAQRVWLVEPGERISRSYLVSGSVHNNLPPGSYTVFSRARQATAYDYESQLGYFVGFFQGKNATIGFHDIPVGNDGKLLQTAAELGTPLSSGCVRQNLPDAVKLWEFAPQGTPVVVLA